MHESLWHVDRMRSLMICSLHQVVTGGDHWANSRVSRVHGAGSWFILFLRNVLFHFSWTSPTVWAVYLHCSVTILQHKLFEFSANRVWKQDKKFTFIIEGEQEDLRRSPCVTHGLWILKCEEPQTSRINIHHRSTLCSQFDAQRFQSSFG